MRVMVTRPREDSVSLQRALLRKGVEVVLEPLLTIDRISDVEFDLEGVHALLFTSANGVRAFAAACAAREVRVFAVGDATAKACKEEGFKQVFSAGGDIEDLAALVRRSCEPRDGRLIHVAGNVAAGELAADLSSSGFDIIRTPLYESRQADALSAAGKAALQQGRIDAILFFSPRTAATFVKLAKEAGLQEACRRIDSVCLSPAVAKRASDAPWRRTAIAAEPTQEALIAAIGAPGSRNV